MKKTAPGACGSFSRISGKYTFTASADHASQHDLQYEILAFHREVTVSVQLADSVVDTSVSYTHLDLGPAAYDVEQYAEEEVRRIAEVAFDMAMKRNKKVTSVDKANVLESSRLWRRVVAEVAEKYPEVELNNLYIDNAAMQMVRNPKQFDVIVTSNISVSYTHLLVLRNSKSNHNESC